MATKTQPSPENYRMAKIIFVCAGIAAIMQMYIVGTGLLALELYETRRVNKSKKRI